MKVTITIEKYYSPEQEKPTVYIDIMEVCPEMSYETWINNLTIKYGPWDSRERPIIVEGDFDKIEPLDPMTTLGKMGIKDGDTFKMLTANLE